MANEPGQAEDERATLLTRKEVIKLAIARSKETPIKYLSPEAHEDALKAEKTLWIEGMALLGKDSMCQIKTPEHHMWNVYGKEKIQGMDDLPKDTEFILLGMNSSVENVNGENVKYTNQIRYAVTPKGVIMIERNWADTVVPHDKRLPIGEPRTPKGLGLEKTELGRDEINDVVKLIQTRVAHYPNQG